MSNHSAGLVLPADILLCARTHKIAIIRILLVAVMALVEVSLSSPKLSR